MAYDSSVVKGERIDAIIQKTVWEWALGYGKDKKKVLRKKGQIWQQRSVSSFIEKLASKLGPVLFTEFKARGGHCRLMEVWAKRASQWLRSKGVSGTVRPVGTWTSLACHVLSFLCLQCSSCVPLLPQVWPRSQVLCESFSSNSSSFALLWNPLTCAVYSSHFGARRLLSSWAGNTAFSLWFLPL